MGKDSLVEVGLRRLVFHAHAPAGQGALSLGGSITFGPSLGHKPYTYA